MTPEEAKAILIDYIQTHKDSKYTDAIIRALTALDIELALDKLVEHWRNNE